MTPWTVARQISLSLGFSRQEYWSGLPLPSRGDLPNPGSEHRSLALQADSLPSEPPGKPLIMTEADVKLRTLHPGWRAGGGQTPSQPNSAPTSKLWDLKPVISTPLSLCFLIYKIRKMIPSVQHCWEVGDTNKQDGD